MNPNYYTDYTYFICRWNVTDWSPCSKSCGRGHRSRNVTCVQVKDALSDPGTRDPEECLEEKPRSNETCNSHHCYDHWHEGSWSEVIQYHCQYKYLNFLLNIQCSSYCGNGTRIRNVTCINAHGKEEETNNCSLLVKPTEEENCTGEMCTYRWTASNWSNVRLSSYGVTKVLLCFYADSVQYIVVRGTRPELYTVNISMRIGLLMTVCAYKVVSQQ